MGYVKITQDQSEKKKLFDQLHNKIEEYKAINAELNNFAHTASHDLKAPFNNIEGLAVLIKKDLQNKLPEDKHILNLADFMHQSALKFKSILTDMATSAKEETEDYTYQTFNDASNEIKDLLSHEIKSTGATFLEDYSEVKYIRYPRKHICSILHNLILNAIKYRSPERQPKIKLKTARDMDLSYLKYRIMELVLKSKTRNEYFQ